MPEELHDITSAQPALSDDQPGRKRKYFISMMIRTACFLATLVTPSPIRWFFLFGALVLPYFAVIIANAGRETLKPGDSVIHDRRKSIN